MEFDGQGDTPVKRKKKKKKKKSGWLRERKSDLGSHLGAGKDG